MTKTTKLPARPATTQTKLGDQLSLISLRYAVVVVVLRLNVPVNNFSVMSGRSHRFLGN